MNTIKSRAAVAFAPNEPLKIVEIDVERPKKGEVLVKITHTGVCHTETARDKLHVKNEINHFLFYFIYRNIFSFF